MYKKIFIFLCTLFLTVNITLTPFASVNVSPVPNLQDQEINNNYLDTQDYYFFHGTPRQMIINEATPYAGEGLLYSTGKLLISALLVAMGVVITSKEVLEEVCQKIWNNVNFKSFLKVTTSVASLVCNPALIALISSILDLDVPKEDVKTHQSSQATTGTSYKHSFASGIYFNSTYSFDVLKDTRCAGYLNFTYYSDVDHAASSWGTGGSANSDSVKVLKGDVVGFKPYTFINNLGQLVIGLNMYVNGVKKTWWARVLNADDNRIVSLDRISIMYDQSNAISRGFTFDKTIPYSKSDFSYSPDKVQEYLPSLEGTISVPMDATKAPDVPDTGLTMKEIETSSTTDTGRLDFTPNNNDKNDESPTIIVIPKPDTQITDNSDPVNSAGVDFSPIQNTVTNVMSKVVTEIKDFFGTLYDQVLSTTKSILNYIKMIYNTITQTVVGIMDTISAKVKSIDTFLSTKLDPYYTDVKNYLESIAQSVAREIKIELPSISFLEVVPDLLTSIKTNLESWIVELPGKIQEFPKKIYEWAVEIGSYIIAMPDAIGDYISALPEAIGTKISGLWTNLSTAYESIKDKIGFIGDSIGSKVDAVKDGVKEGTDSLKEGLKEAFIPTINIGELIITPDEDNPMESFDFSPIFELEPKEFVWEGDITFGNTTHHLVIAPFRVDIVADNLDTMRKVFTYTLLFMLILHFIRKFEPVRVMD